MDERRSVIWKFLSRGGRIHATSVDEQGLVSDDTRVFLHDPEAVGGPKEYKFTAEEYNTEVTAWRAAMLSQKAETLQPATAETPQQRWYRSSAWFKGDSKP
jgi:hypothetical protein